MRFLTKEQEKKYKYNQNLEKGRKLIINNNKLL